MIYDVTQVSTYEYQFAVPFARHLLRLTPIDRRHQRVLSAKISVRPSERSRSAGFDFFGNSITRIEIDTPHEVLRVEMKARIRVDPAELPMADLTAPWEEIRARGTVGDLVPQSPLHMAFASRNVPLSRDTREYAALSFTPSRPVLQAAIDLCSRIYNDFDYEPGSTEITTTPAEALEQRSGVCQDFAHVMIAGLRGLGLPAGYVSGYLRTVPPSGKPRLEGADATHAWVCVWCGPDLGWIGLDPTNNVMAGEDHIVLAIGRDYADVAPIDGVIVGSGAQELTVGVDVIPLGRDGLF